MIQAHGGLNVYLGNRPSGDGGARARLAANGISSEGEASRASTMREDQDDYYLQRTVDEIAERPFAYLRLLAVKLLWTVQAVELRDTHSYEFFRLASPLLRWLPGFGFAIALAVVRPDHVARTRSSVVDGLRRRVTLTADLPGVGMRYRVPLVPVVIAFAGAGVAALIVIVRERRWRDLAAPAAAALVMTLFTHARSDAASLNVSEEWTFTGLGLLRESDPRGLGDGTTDRARARSAIELRVGWPRLALQRKGANSEATDAFAKAWRSIPRMRQPGCISACARAATRPAGRDPGYRRRSPISPERTETVRRSARRCWRPARLMKQSRCCRRPMRATTGSPPLPSPASPCSVGCSRRAALRGTRGHTGALGAAWLLLAQARW